MFHLKQNCAAENGSPWQSIVDSWLLTFSDQIFFAQDDGVGKSTMKAVTDDSTSNSTIQLQFSESTTAQMLPTKYDDNNNSHVHPSFEECGSRKRCASTTSQQTIDEEEEDTMKKKHRTLSRNARHRHLSPSSESDEIQRRTRAVPNTSVSGHDDTEKNFEWLKDFMRQSVDTIRDTVVQACITAISARSISALNARMPTRDRNVNNHLARLVRSDHSVALEKANDRLRISSIMRHSRSFVQLQNMFDSEQEYLGKQPHRVHHRARASPYPMYINVLRTPVSDSNVPWSRAWVQYQPIVFTAEEVYISPGADPDLLRSPSSVCLHFNTIDGVIDRRSVYQQYPVDEHNGLPLNPIGRTGLRGRGMLLRWGPNVYHYVLICRWKQDMHGRTLVHPFNRKKILEVLLEIQTEDDATNDLVLTGGLRMLGSHFPPQLQDRLRRFLIHTGTLQNHPRTKVSTSLLALDHLFAQSPIAWKGAYFDDARNTDNAWIELSIEYLLDADRRLTSCIPSLPSELLLCLEQPRFIWQEVRSTIDLGTRTHYRLIRNLAHKLNAYF